MTWSTGWHLMLAMAICTRRRPLVPYANLVAPQPGVLTKASLGPSTGQMDSLPLE